MCIIDCCYSCSEALNCNEDYLKDKPRILFIRFCLINFGLFSFYCYAISNYSEPLFNESNKNYFNEQFICILLMTIIYFLHAIYYYVTLKYFDYINSNIPISDYWNKFFKSFTNIFYYFLYLFWLVTSLYMFGRLVQYNLLTDFYNSNFSYVYFGNAGWLWARLFLSCCETCCSSNKKKNENQNDIIPYVKSSV